MTVLMVLTTAVEGGGVRAVQLHPGVAATEPCPSSGDVAGVPVAAKRKAKAKPKAAASSGVMSEEQLEAALDDLLVQCCGTGSAADAFSAAVDKALQVQKTKDHCTGKKPDFGIEHEDKGIDVDESSRSEMDSIFSDSDLDVSMKQSLSIAKAVKKDADVIVKPRKASKVSKESKEDTDADFSSFVDKDGWTHIPIVEFPGSYFVTKPGHLNARCGCTSKLCGSLHRQDSRGILCRMNRTTVFAGAASSKKPYTRGRVAALELLWIAKGYENYDSIDRSLHNSIQRGPGCCIISRRAA